MNSCHACAHTLRAGLNFCTNCGEAVQRVAPTPVPAPTRPPAPVPRAAPFAPATPAGARFYAAILVASLVGTLVIGIMGLALSTYTNSGHPSAGTYTYTYTAPAVTTQQFVSPPDTWTPTTMTTATTTTTTTTVDPEQSARAQLTALVAQDHSAVEALVGSWIPQLSSKRPGLVANGITYDYVAILRDYEDLKQRFPTALLLWSGDYTSYDYTDFWVTVEPASFGVGAQANAWCDGQGIDADNCYAKRLVHTGGPDGTTVQRK
jgi:hypothetical protein